MGADQEPMFSVLHLGWMVEHGLVDVPYALGPVVYSYGEFHEGVVADLQTWGVLSDDAQRLTPEAQRLFSALNGDKLRWWGKLTLYNERRPLTIQAPEDFADAISSLPDTPAVYWLIAETDAGFVAAVRAGYHITIYPVAGTSTATVASAIRDIVDPAAQWSVPSFSPFTVPLDTMRECVPYGLADDEELRELMRKQLRAELKAKQVPAADAKKYQDLLEAETVAISSVMHSSTWGDKSDRSGSLLFVKGAGLLCALTDEQQTSVTYAPASPEHLASVVRGVAQSPHHVYLHNL